MKTYAETKGLAPYDWNDFLDRAIRGEVSKSESEEAKELAEGWPTCACGSQCDRILRDRLGLPKDRELRILGFSFCGSMVTGSYRRAKDTLERIEFRSSEILQEMDK